MKPSIKKAVSGKSMRVATTFTGVAACAAAFAPAAVAGAQPPVARPGHQPLINGLHAVRPDAITVKPCSAAGTSHWLHLALGHSGVCLGGTGFKDITVSISKFCGGNNSGTLHGNSVFGARVQHHFGHGTFYAHIGSIYRVTSVDMDGFSGTDRCPAP